MSDSKQVTDLSAHVHALEGNQKAMLARVETLEQRGYALRDDLDALDTSRAKPVSFYGPVGNYTLDPDGQPVTDPADSRPCGCEDSQRLAIELVREQRACGELGADCSRFVTERDEARRERDEARRLLAEEGDTIRDRESKLSTLRKTNAEFASEILRLKTYLEDTQRANNGLRTGLSNMEFRCWQTEITNADFATEVLELRAFRDTVAAMLRGK